jgi:hypothetical protein
MAPPSVVVPECQNQSGPFAWSCHGPIPGTYCTQIDEPADPNTWQDNFFCSANDIGVRWSHAGPIRGMACTQTFEYSDPNSWLDNYLCVPPTSRFYFVWSSAGPLQGMNCLRWWETSDPNTWGDNYLCWGTRAS